MAVLRLAYEKFFPNAPKCPEFDCEKAQVTASLESLNNPVTSSTPKEVRDPTHARVPSVADLTGRPDRERRLREPGIELDNIETVRAQIHGTDV